jgi:hypothetical protein
MSTGGATTGGTTVDDESLPIPTDAPPIVIGNEMGATTWVPEARPSEPLVDAAGVVVPAGAVVPQLTPSVGGVESPSRTSEVRRVGKDF